ncbi:MAG: VIT and VWA domain-containing protein [Candidatus Obscuribacterales bacterium]|nr:VIT and VWA domain-containing protein [Candidatus Obscuribacterales bacterium]
MHVFSINLRSSARIAMSLMAALALSNSFFSMTQANAENRARKLSLAGQNQSENQSNFTGEGSGKLLAMLTSGKQLGQCPLKHTDVKASVSGYISRVSVKQTFQNKFSQKIEAVYTFPLPENAAVDEMTMRIGDRVIKGNIKKREEAREIYESAKAQGHVASLLDQERSNIFTQSVANIEPGAKIEIEIKYVETLPYEAGSYTFNFPTVVGPRFIPGSQNIGRSGRGRIPDTDKVPDASRITPKPAAAGERAGHDISISLDIDAAVQIQDIKSDLHEVKIDKTGEKAHVELIDKNSIPNRDFVLHWAVAQDKIQSGYLTHRDDKSGYFTLILLPPKRVSPETASPKEMVFLVDCSGSQSGAPLDKAKETLNYIVEHMNSNDTFQIVAFSNGQKLFAEHPQLASNEMKARAKSFIASLEANGGTWMGPAVEKVCALPNDSHRLRIVTFMTDGYVGNDMEILGLIKKYRGASRWFSFGTGNSVNRFLIDGIAKEGGGEADYVLLNSPGAVVGKKFYDRISSPVLTDVKVNFNGLEVKEVYPHEQSDVWAEKPLYIKGRYLKAGAGTITLTGYSGGKPYKQDLKVVFPEKNNENAVIKPIWARAKVDRLMSEDWFAAQSGNPNKEIKDEIVRTALDQHIMTQYTSFVAVEEKRVTKGNKSQTVDVPIEVPDGVQRSSVYEEAEDSLGAPIARAVSLGGSGGGGGYGAAFSNGPVRAGGGGYGASYSSSPVRGRVLSKRQSASSYASNLSSAEAFKTAPKAPSLPSMQPSPTIGPVAQAPMNSAPPVFYMRSSKQNQESKDKKGLEQNRASKLDAALKQLLDNKKRGLENNAGLQITNGTLMVKIELSELNEKLIKELKALGVEIIVSNQKTKTVTARIKVEKLEKLLELNQVVKVEAAQNP